MAAGSLTPVTVRGRYFWAGDQRFMIKGVVYQLHDKARSSSDPLVDDRIDDLRRDVELFKELGLNTLFVYSIDNKRCHDASMRLLEEAGIYVLVGLSTATRAINRAAPLSSYNSQLLDEYFTTIDCMAQYPNTLGLIVANEILNSSKSTAAAPIIRTLTRDVKRYMKTAAEVTGQRRLPVGYSASTCRLILKTTYDYLTAGAPEESIDFFCYNNYNWCGQSSMHISGYNHELKVFANTHIPVFFSEYGSNLGGTRIFQETTAIYSPAMTRVFSGGVAYEFFEGSNRYGLIKLDQGVERRVTPTGTTTTLTTTLTKLPDYFNLQARLRDCIKVAPEMDPEWVVPAVEEAEEGGEKPGFPALSNSWMAGSDTIPQSKVDWNRTRERFEDRVWVDVGKVLRDEAVDESLVRAVESHLQMQQRSGGGSSWGWRRSMAMRG